jgi:hypothetical protein
MTLRLVTTPPPPCIGYEDIGVDTGFDTGLAPMVTGLEPTVREVIGYPPMRAPPMGTEARVDISSGLQLLGRAECFWICGV